jgi:hypothetical protein
MNGKMALLYENHRVGFLHKCVCLFFSVGKGGLPRVWGFEKVLE